MNPDAPQSPDPTSLVPIKAKLRRYDMKKLLADPELRRKLVVQSTIATQAREGIDVSEAEVEDSYYVVTQGERISFFGLVPFRTDSSENDGRHREFVNAITSVTAESRIDITRADFGIIEGAPLAYDKLAYAAPIFRLNPNTDSVTSSIEQGVAIMNVARYVRFHWEILSSGISRSQSERSSEKPWVRLSKGGDFCRFYYDFNLVIFAQSDWEDMKHEINERYPYLKGNSSMLIHPDNSYFREGITWPRRTQRGFNARLLPSGHIFADKGPTAFLKRTLDIHTALGVFNSELMEYLFKALVSFGSWEIIGLRRTPFPEPMLANESPVGALAKIMHEAKAAWDSGNEICTRFDRPWLLQSSSINNPRTLAVSLDEVLNKEAGIDTQLAATYAQLNDVVYRLYSVNETLRAKIEVSIGERPPELVWPQMEGKDRDQKRREHVDRLLTYLVKQILTEDEDHLVCLQRVAHEPPLLDRLREKLAACFPAQDPSSLETEVVNELKKKTKGYHRAESLAEWLHDVFFETHNALYQQRPLLWHLASSQTRTEPGFACLVHAHHFDADALAKLRSVYIRDRIAVLKREAAQAGNDGKADLRLDLLALAEEVEAYDAKLALLQEGAHTGPEGGERDYRILTPWKTPETRPQGWHPDVDDGIKVNLAPLARTKLLRINLKLGTTESDE
jgi:hypothetical protein